MPAPREYPRARQVRIMSRDRLERGQRVAIWAMGKISPTPTFAPTRPQNSVFPAQPRKLYQTPVLESFIEAIAMQPQGGQGPT